MLNNANTDFELIVSPVFVRRLELLKEGQYPGRGRTSKPDRDTFPDCELAERDKIEPRLDLDVFVFSVVHPDLDVVLATVLNSSGSDDAVTVNVENRFGAFEQFAAVVANKI